MMPRATEHLETTMTIPSWTTPLRTLKLTIHMGALEMVDLPPFMGSTLRGAFGAALKSVGCAGKEQRSCSKACAWPTRCPYGQLMETPVPEDAPGRIKASRFAPHPIVLTPPAQGGGALFPGDTLTFHVTLIGRGLRLIKPVIAALARMASLGMGKGRGELALRRVVDAASDEMVWSDDGDGDVRTRALTPKALGQTSSPEADGPITIEFVTPVQLMRRGDVVRAFDLGELVYAAADRLWLLSSVHAPSSPQIDAAALAKAARAAPIEVLEDEMKMVRVQRYSGRQERRHGLEGLVGRAVISGDAAPFVRLLRAAAMVHVGKKTSFGFGHVEVR